MSARLFVWMMWGKMEMVAEIILFLERAIEHATAYTRSSPRTQYLIQDTVGRIHQCFLPMND